MDSDKMVLAVFERTSGVMEKPLPGEAFRLNQNYPNPFNAKTTIGFSLSRPGPTSLKIFDAAGREMASLVDGPLQAGNHRFVFEAGSLPSGVYLYRLSGLGHVAVKKIVVMN